MQAYRLRIADGHHTQVVKVCVEPRSNCAAFVLADSSCLLVSLSSLPAIQRTSIPAPCTDACFLRLQARVLAGGGSSLSSRAYPLDRGASGGFSTSGGELSEQYAKVGEAGGGEAGKGIPRVGGRGRIGSKLPTNGNGKGVAGNTHSRVYFLTSQPAKGGSCIDLFAWHCEPPSFSRAHVEIDRSMRSSKGPEFGDLDHVLQGRLARKERAARLDIPHGMAMKMVASINVVIVYSISAGKIWILAAKHVGPPELSKEQGGRSVRGSGVSPVEKDLETGLSCKRAESGQDGETSGHLFLMKCAVLGCNRPVYSMHVSPQHLLLGEAGGVWIWPLRPLIKPDKRVKRERERLKDSTFRSEDSRVLAPSSSKFQADASVKDPTHFSVVEASNGEVNAAPGCKPVEWKLTSPQNERQQVEDQQLDSQATVADISDLNPGPKNGIYTHKGDEKEHARRVCEGLRTRGVPRNGFYEKEKKVCLVVNTNCLANGYTSEADSRPRESLSEVNGHQQDVKGQAMGNSLCVLPLTLGISSKNDYQKVSSMAPKHVGAAVKEDLQVVPAGALYSKEDGDLLGKRAIIESLWKTGVPQKRNGVVFHCGNVQDRSYNVEGSQSFSSGSEGVGSFETNTPLEDSHPSDEKPLDFVKQKQGLGFVGPMFVSTCKESQQDGIMACKGVLQAQVVDIQEISLRRFVVLDSSGELHLLALEDDKDRGTNSSLRVNHPKITALSTSVKVSSMAVLLPALQSTTVEAKRGAVRKIWISDGSYSNYVAVIPESSEEVSSEARNLDTGRVAALPVKVSQTVFTSERVATLAAVPAETVLVVTQGKEFVLIGSKRLGEALSLMLYLGVDQEGMELLSKPELTRLYHENIFVRVYVHDLEQRPFSLFLTTGAFLQASYEGLEGLEEQEQK